MFKTHEAPPSNDTLTSRRLAPCPTNPHDDKGHSESKQIRDGELGKGRPHTVKSPCPQALRMC